MLGPVLIIASFAQHAPLGSLVGNSKLLTAGWALFCLATSLGIIFRARWGLLLYSLEIIGSFIPQLFSRRWTGQVVIVPVIFSTVCTVGLLIYGWFNRWWFEANRLIPEPSQPAAPQAQEAGDSPTKRRGWGCAQCDARDMLSFFRYRWTFLLTVALTLGACLCRMVQHYRDGNSLAMPAEGLMIPFLAIAVWLGLRASLHYRHAPDRVGYVRWSVVRVAAIALAGLLVYWIVLKIPQS